MSRICYIYKTNCRKGHFHFFCRPANITFVSSCEFNGLVSKSCRIPPAALFFTPKPPEVSGQALKGLRKVANIS
jgi:hypothetical protein